MMRYFDFGNKDLDKMAENFGLDLNAFLKLPKEYREAFIHGSFITERNKNNIENNEISKPKVLKLIKK